MRRLELADTGLEAGREDAEALFKVIVEVIGGVTCAEAVGGVAGGQAEGEGGRIVEKFGVGLDDGGECGVAGDAVFGDGDVHGLRICADVGVDVDGGVDGKGGVDAEGGAESVGGAGGEDDGPAVAGVVLGAGAERGVDAVGEGNDAGRARSVGGTGADEGSGRDGLRGDVRVGEEERERKGAGGGEGRARRGEGQRRSLQSTAGNRLWNRRGGGQRTLVVGGPATAYPKVTPSLVSKREPLRPLRR
jgi:hypothetical protein